MNALTVPHMLSEPVPGSIPNTNDEATRQMAVQATALSSSFSGQRAGQKKDVARPAPRARAPTHSKPVAKAPGSMLQDTEESTEELEDGITNKDVAHPAPRAHGPTHCTPVAKAPGSMLQDTEELEDGITKMPCRARGVPSHHTFATAYFLIKKDTPHGELLNCSHPFCSEKGFKFRYCMFCKLPVAKRNFTKRHSHLPTDSHGRQLEPGSVMGREILSEEPIRLTAQERDFLNLLRRRPPLEAPENDVKGWLDECLEVSKPIPKHPYNTIMTRGASASVQQLAGNGDRDEESGPVDEPKDNVTVTAAGDNVVSRSHHVTSSPKSTASLNPASMVMSIRDHALPAPAPAPAPPPGQRPPAPAFLSGAPPPPGGPKPALHTGDHVAVQVAMQQGHGAEEENQSWRKRRKMSLDEDYIPPKP